jgi:hypothetical protein
MPTHEDGFPDEGDLVEAATKFRIRSVSHRAVALHRFDRLRRVFLQSVAAPIDVTVTANLAVVRLLGECEPRPMSIRTAASITALAIVGPGCLSPQIPASPSRTMSAREQLAEPANPNERFYIILFASQATPRVPARSHTWATAVKVTQVPNAEPQIETHTISWLPDSMNVRWWKFTVEPGSNFSNEFSIEHALQTKQRVSAWGPYEISPNLFKRFVMQKAFLDSDAIGYQCTDMIGESARRGNGCDCFHAISDMDPDLDRGSYPLRYFGDRATLNIVRQVHERPILIQPWVTHDWLFAALGLDRYPICRRRYDGAFIEYSPEAVLAYHQQREAERSKSKRCN